MVQNHKAGFISIIGKPNAGKSTLLNAFLNTPLSIVTPKVQTTRHRILGIYNDDTHQIVFSDTPGIIQNPAYELHNLMLKNIWKSLEDTDGVLLVIDPEDMPNPEQLTAWKVKIPKLLAIVINKMDVTTQQKIEQVCAELTLHWPDAPVFTISAKLLTNVVNLRSYLCDAMPVHPPYFDKEDISDRHIRFFMAEFIREQLFLMYAKEIPYSADVQVIDYREKKDIDVIMAEIYVERDSQKGIIIGHNGEKLKLLSTKSRLSMENFIQKKVFLDIKIKVVKDWRKNLATLKKLGYT